MLNIGMSPTLVLRCLARSVNVALFFSTLFGGGQAYAQEPNARLADLPDNSWTLFSHGDVTSPVSIMAYSGGWYDNDNHQFCIFGGGHYNYSGNEVWCFDLSSLQWKILYQADVNTDPPYDGGDQGAYNNFDNERYPGALFSPAGESIENARPMSRHTYDQMEYIGGFGLFMWGGYAWGDSSTPWCDECPDYWRFDFSDSTWTYLYHPGRPSPNEAAGVGASAFSRHDGMLYAKVRNTTWRYDPDGNKWSRIRTRGNPPWSIEGTLEYDPNHRNLYYFGGNYSENHALWKYDIAKRTWTEIAAVNDGPSGGSNNGPGVAYDSNNDVLAVYSGGTMWIYDPAENSWETLRPEHRPTDESYVFGRFRYDPLNNGFWLHAPDNGSHSTWFYRYKN